MNNYLVYNIKHNDTLWQISRRFGITVNDILVSNENLTLENIHVGQEIKIPNPMHRDIRND